jgi:DNA-binding beta-propeller fold protein YncE
MGTRRRRTLSLAALVAVLALAAPAAAREVLFVGNVADGTVSVVDAVKLRVLGRIDVIPDGNTPQDPAQAAIYPGIVAAKGVDYVQGLAVAPNGRTLYVSRGYLGDVAAFDIASGHMLWRLQIAGIRADHVALSKDGRRLFVSALTANEVQVIDTATHAFVGSFKTGDWPHVLELTPDARTIVNGSLGNQLLPGGSPTSRTLTFADPKTLAVRKSFSFDAGVRPFTFSPDGRRIYVQLSFLNGFQVVDAATGKTLKTVALPLAGPAIGEDPSDYPNQAAHHGITLAGDARTICDAATVSNYVALVDRRTLKTRKLIVVGDQPAEAETSLDGKLCFVADRGPASNALSVISFARRREIKRIRLGTRPQEEAVANVPLRGIPKAWQRTTPKSSSKQGGTTQQKKAAGRKGGKAAAKKS